MKMMMKTKMFKGQKTMTQTIAKVTGKFLNIFLVKILVLNGYLKSYETECLDNVTRQIREDEHLN